MTNKQGHTPGPWETILDKPSARHRMAMVTTGDGFRAIDATGSSHTWDGDVANARLIAAAPDLLAALEAFISHHERQGGHDGGWPHYAQARAAIAKAKGVI